MLERVVEAIAGWAQDAGHECDIEERATLRDELAGLVMTQPTTFATPVWLNAGLAAVRSSREPVSRSGLASGPVSFMRATGLHDTAVAEEADLSVLGASHHGRWARPRVRH